MTKSSGKQGYLSPTVKSVPWIGLWTFGIIEQLDII